jgi:nicotinamide riboside transporter PnuC
MNPNQHSRLFSVGQIAVATFLGSPLPGILLIAKNCSSKGRQSEARSTALWAIGFTVAVIVLAFILPDSVPASGLAIGYTMGVFQWAKQKQGKEIEEHIANGGSLASWWTTIGIGLAGLVVVGALIFGVVLVIPIDG